MAKKNSSKTATKEAIQASEPRLQRFTGWTGINFKESPLGWHYYDESKFQNHDYRFHQTDLRPNYLLLQNNVETTDSLTLETRKDSELLALRKDDGWEHTGVACLFHRWLFVVAKQTIHDQEHPEDPEKDTYRYHIGFHDITNPVDDKDKTINKTNPDTGQPEWEPYSEDPETGEHNGTWVDNNGILRKTNWKINDWVVVPIRDAEEGLDPKNYEITEIGYYQEKLIMLARHRNKDERDPLDNEYDKFEGEIFTADLQWLNNPDRKVDTLKISYLKSALKIPEPIIPPTLQAVGQASSGSDQQFTRVSIYYSYVNQYGSTLVGPSNFIFTEYNPVAWSSLRYLKISANIEAIDKTTHEQRIHTAGELGIEGIDFYCTLNDNSDAIFIGHIEITPDQTQWSYNWLGAMEDVSMWMNSQLTMPTENNTKGVTARYFNVHDSRLYFWGDPEHPYRLWIGGNPGAELSVARGLGGAWVDVEPGSGIEVHGTEKWKTVSGANIVTMLCGNPNTNRVKRFNLVETNTAVTNEISHKSYMYEEVSNVVGCNSRWGHGVFADGLYTISRYGLMLTTMAMEYNSQMRNQQVSDVIQPIFTERISRRLSDARLVFIDDVIYIILSEEKEHDEEPQSLDRVILCYDINAKAWYTFTHDGEDELLLHAMPIDYEGYTEGLGILTESEVYLYPTTGIQDTTSPEFDVLIETGELAARTPIQENFYLEQIELRFDYFIGEAEVIVQGVDYYGRDFTVTKQLNRQKYGLNPDGTYGPDNAEMRHHTEWIRVQKNVESYRIHIKGKARFRMTHINVKGYTQSSRIGLPYGFDANDSFINRHKQEEKIHHYIKDYNNLRKAIVT